jgi:hypothetical protein
MLGYFSNFHKTAQRKRWPNKISRKFAQSGHPDSIALLKNGLFSLHTQEDDHLQRKCWE